VATGVALLVRGDPALAFGAAAVSFFGLLSALSAWPAEFRLPRWASSS
jgi:hypothetical protein